MLANFVVYFLYFHYVLYYFYYKLFKIWGGEPKSLLAFKRKYEGQYLSFLQGTDPMVLTYSKYSVLLYCEYNNLCKHHQILFIKMHYHGIAKNVFQYYQMILISYFSPLYKFNCLT